jgi:hypothetical protein
MHTAFNQSRQHVRSCARRSDRGDSVDAIGPPSPSITVSFPWRKAWKPQRSIPSFSSSSRACASARDPHPTAFHFPWRRVTQADSVSRCEGVREDAPQVAEKFRRDDCPCSTSPSRSSRARPFPARLLFADDTPLPPSSQTYCRWARKTPKPANHDKLYATTQKGRPTFLLDLWIHNPTSQMNGPGDFVYRWSVSV